MSTNNESEKQHSEAINEKLNRTFTLFTRNPKTLKENGSESWTVPKDKIADVVL